MPRTIVNCHFVLREFMLRRVKTKAVEQERTSMNFLKIEN